MPRQIWIHECCSDLGETHPTAKNCSICGKPGVAAGWKLSIIEMMGQYQRAYGLKAIGHHRPLSDEVFQGMRECCAPCGGSGYVGQPERRQCPHCEGAGGAWKASEEELMSAYGTIVNRHPEARAPGTLGWIFDSVNKARRCHHGKPPDGA